MKIPKPIIILLLIVLSAFALVKSHQREIVSNANGQLYMSDFAYHMLIFSSVDEPRKSNIYNIAFQENVLSKHLGTTIKGAMPIGTPPFVIMALSDSSKYAIQNLRLSQTIWNCISVLILLTACLNWSRLIPQERQWLFAVSILCLFLLSPIFMRVLDTGQTSLFATGILLHILYELRQNKISSIKLSVQTLLLAIKPTYLLLALAILLIHNKYRAAINVAALSVLLTICSVVVFGLSDLKDYFAILKMYSSADIPAHYASSIVYDRMNNFLVAFSALFELKNIAPFANVFFYLEVAAAIIFQKKNFISAPAAIVSVIASYLIFCPYLIAEEEIIAFIPIAMLLAFSKAKNAGIYLSLISLFVLLNHNIFGSTLDNMWLFWIVKVCVLGFISLRLVSPESGKQHRNFA